MRALAAAIALGVLCTSLPAQAHFGPEEVVDQSWHEWADRQWSVSGGRCCNPGDAHLYKGAYRYEYDANGQIEAVILLLEDGQEIPIPKRRFVDVKPGDPNPTGHPVIWFHEISEAYCWASPGPLA